MEKKNTIRVITPSTTFTINLDLMSSAYPVSESRVRSDFTFPYLCDQTIADVAYEPMPPIGGQETLFLVKLLKHLQVPEDTICERIGQVVDARWWYPVYYEVEGLVNARYMLTSPRTVTEFGAMMEKVTNQHALYLSMMKYITQLDFSMGFDGSDPDTLRQVRACESARRKLNLLIDPYTLPPEAFTYPGKSTGQFWHCDMISLHPRPKPGDNMLMPAQRAHEIILEFTDGLLSRMPEEFANRVIPCGGSISKAVCARYVDGDLDYSDLDLFIIGKNFTERKMTFDGFLQWLAKDLEQKYSARGASAPCRPYFSVRGSAVNVYVPGTTLKIQIISCRHTTVGDILQAFDQDRVMWAYVNGRFLGTASALLALRTQVTEFNPAGKFGTWRLVKALRYGYDIANNPLIIEQLGCDFDAAITDPTSGIIREGIQYGLSVYYPTSVGEDNSNGVLRDIGMLLNCDKATIVTRDVEEAIKNTVLDVNFAQGYRTMPVGTFTQAMISVQKSRTALCSNEGQITFSADGMCVTRCLVVENELHIGLRPPPGFMEFVALLEGPVYRLFNAGGTNESIVSDGVMELAMRHRDEKSNQILVAKRGDPMNILEDLHEGDVVSIRFNVTILRHPRKVNIRLRRIIKNDVVIPSARLEVKDDAGEEIKYES